MNISEFTETRIRYEQDGKQELLMTPKGGMAETIAVLLSIAQKNPNVPVKVISVSIVKRGKNKTHEIFV